jgi:hypothetical protein
VCVDHERTIPNNLVVNYKGLQVGIIRTESQEEEEVLIKLCGEVTTPDTMSGILTMPWVGCMIRDTLTLGVSVDMDETTVTWYNPSSSLLPRYDPHAMLEDGFKVIEILQTGEAMYDVACFFVDGPQSLATIEAYLRSQLSDKDFPEGAAKEVMDLLVEKGKLKEDAGSYFSHGYKETQHHSRRPSSGRGGTLAEGRSGSFFGPGVAVYRLRTDEKWGGDTPTSQIPCLWGSELASIAHVDG